MKIPYHMLDDIQYMEAKMAGFDGYDQWKTASPYDDEPDPIEEGERFLKETEFYESPAESDDTKYFGHIAVAYPPSQQDKGHDSDVAGRIRTARAVIQALLDIV